MVRFDRLHEAAGPCNSNKLLSTFSFAVIYTVKNNTVLNKHMQLHEDVISLKQINIRLE